MRSAYPVAYAAHPVPGLPDRPDGPDDQHRHPHLLHDAQLRAIEYLHGLVLAESAQALQIAVFVMRASFRDLPHELRDAGLVDG